MPLDIRARGLRFHAGGREVLRVGELRLQPGESVALLGENGGGKTSLLRILAGLERRFEGAVDYGGVSHSRHFGTSRRPLDPLMVSQHPVLFSMGVADNIGFGLKGRVAASEVSRRVGEAADLLGILPLLSIKGSRLSGGEVRLVALARAWVMQPSVLLLDEPFAGLDADRAGRLQDALRSRFLHRPDASLLFSTHREGEALDLASRVLRLSDGRLSPHETVNTFRGEAFVGGDGYYFRVQGGPALETGPFSRPTRLVHVPPKSVIVSREAAPTSARNRFRGSVAALKSTSSGVEVAVVGDIALTALLTSHAVRDLALVPGDNVYFQFKAGSVEFLDGGGL